MLSPVLFLMAAAAAPVDDCAAMTEAVVDMLDKEYLGVPMIAAGNDIAEAGLNRTGVPVDVTVNWASHPDPWRAIRSVFND